MLFSSSIYLLFNVTLNEEEEKKRIILLINKEC